MNEPSQSRLMKLAREPLVHFFAMAAVIFLVYGISRWNGGDILEIHQRDIDARIFMREMTAGQPLDEAERRAVTFSYVEEQVLVREALALGLDRDARIHDMLAQKMLHVLSGDVIQPTGAELADYYQANLERYRSPALVSVNELVLDNAGALSAEAQALLAAGAEAEAVLAIEPGNAGPLDNANRLDLSNIFDAGFSEAVFEAAPQTWVGPFVSNRGQHWLMVTERSGARLAPLAEVTDRVRLDWIADREDARLRVEIGKLMDRYTIIIRDDEQH